MILFKKVKEPYGWLSNMSPHPVQGYRTAEALFQALRFTDPAIRELIKAEKSPMGAKIVAKKHVAQMTTKPRSEEDLEIMRDVLRMKIEAHPDLLKALLDTGDEEIVEDVSARPNESGLFWGAVVALGSRAGQNWLGRLWMDLRKELRDQS